MSVRPMITRSRMMFLASCALLLAAFSTAPAQQPGQPARGPAASASLTTKQVRGNLYQVAGGGGNSFFYVGADEVLLFDAKISPDAGRALLAEIKKVTDKPLRRVILTHSDSDHVGGLAALPPGLTIMAQANARQEMAPANGAARLPLPTVTFSQELTLYLGETEIRMFYFGPAHTHGDNVILFPADKIAIAGDLIFIGRDPLIHQEKGGTSFGLVAVLKSLLKLDADLFLSGHSDPVDRKTVEGLLAQIEQKQAQVKALVQEGKSLAEVKKALGVTDAPGARRWPSLVEVIYSELSAKK